MQLQEKNSQDNTLLKTDIILTTYKLVKHKT